YEEKRNLSEQERILTEKSDDSGSEYKEAEEKYRANRKTKEPQKIFDNFSPKGSQYENERNALLDSLKSLQMQFNMTFTQDFTVGTSQIQEYREAAEKLRKVEVVKYEEKLLKAKEDCEQIFRSDFLSKMKEHIENAKTEFKNLNKALNSIYYGDDSYHFNITFDKRKENLYRMITSEYNMEGENNLWSSSFETEYREEMEDLFAKLLVRDDKGEQVLEEYTDYRSYLDYDIEIRKRNGSKQRFSDIYGEKSGSETQVPYYVAIAASFYQLYRFGNSVRLMLLDEAFDKMDDDRIKSMMDFFNSLHLQVILATPPGKIEVIGEHVDTILTAIRVGEGSIVEEYDL
ncbi:MAG: cell division protein MukB, partial [Lachnospiraceae bacterium]|nr:cell division protein MukB [Lachnospiraceae bacterium]